MNGIWLALLLGRWAMVTGWRDLLVGLFSDRNKREFVSVDARLDDLKKDTRSYEMLGPVDDSVTPSIVSPVSPTAKLPMRSPSLGNDFNRNDFNSTPNGDGRRTPDYFGNTARYHAPVRSFSSPRPPKTSQTVTWDARNTYAKSSTARDEDGYTNPLGMNRI